MGLRRRSIAVATMTLVLLTAQVAFAAPGELDPSFGTGGITEWGGPGDVGGWLALQADGRVVVAGAYGSREILLTRFTSDGAIDPTFGDAGVVDTTLGEDIDGNIRPLIQPDGRIVVATSGQGSGDVDLILVRYLPDGSPDTSFGEGGVSTIDPAGDAQVIAFDAVLQRTGGIVVVGLYNDAEHDAFLARIDHDGSLDTSFGSGGLTVFDAGGGEVGDEAGWAIAVQGGPRRLLRRDGDLVVAGTTDGDVFVARFGADGALDASFGEDGITITDVGTPVDQVRGLSTGTDGSLTLATQTSGQVLVMRYRADGTPDRRFGEDGTIRTSVYDGAFVGGQALDRRGRLIVGGVTFAMGEIEGFVSRYNPRGMLDPTFGIDGLITLDLGNITFAVSVAADRRARIYTAGMVLDAPGSTLFVYLTRHLAR